MTCAAVRCCVLALALHICVSTVTCTRYVDFSRTPTSRASSAGSDSMLNGKYRSLLVLPGDVCTLGRTDPGDGGCTEGYDCVEQTQSTAGNGECVQEAPTTVDASPSPAEASPSPEVASPSPEEASPSPEVASPSPEVASPSPEEASPSPEEAQASPSPAEASPSPEVAPSPEEASPSPEEASPSPEAALASPSSADALPPASTLDTAAAPPPTIGASAPAPARQPQFGSGGGPSMTPAATASATPAATAAAVFSTALTVPAITSVAALSAYATVAAFDTTEQTRFCAVLEANILKVQGVVANCTITSVVLGSIRVSNTIAFTGSDPAAAEAARNSVATALSSSGTADYFGDSFGEVSVSNVATVTTFNPAATPKSGAAKLAASFMGMLGSLILAVSITCV